MSYNFLAEYYDKLTENVDYKVRSEYISNFFSKYNPNSKSVLDLACGTANISKHLIDIGYDVLGVDLSNEMLIKAYSNTEGRMKLINADISNFNLSKKYDNCICLLDSFNHLDSIEILKKSFDCIYNVLNDNGLFIFDVNTIYKHKYILGNNSFVFDEEDFFLSWDNELEENNRIHIFLDFFVFNGENYDRYSEDFYENAFELSDIKDLLDNFEIIGIYDDLTEYSPKKDSQRVFFVCRKR